MPQLRTVITALLLGLIIAFTIPLLLPATLTTRLSRVNAFKQALTETQRRLGHSPALPQGPAPPQTNNMSTRTPVYFLSHGKSILAPP